MGYAAHRVDRPWIHLRLWRMRLTRAPLGADPAISSHPKGQTMTDRAITALRELIRLKDLKTDALAINTSGSWNAAHRQQHMLAEHDGKKGEAWDAARRALAEFDNSAPLKP